MDWFHRRRRREVLVATILLLGGSFALVASASGTENRSRATPVGKLAVYDRDGRFVGDVIDVPSRHDVVLAMRVGGELITLRANLAGFAENGNTGTSSAPLIYESTDCTGQPYDAIGGLGDEPGLFRLVILNRSKVYGLSGPPQTITYRSAMQDLPDAVCQQDMEPVETSGSPLREVGDLRRFRAPFTLRGSSADDN